MSEPTPARRLWQLWRQGQQPEVREFLARAGDLAPEQVAAVLLVDQRERWRLGERVPAETYLEMYPHLRDDFEYCLELVYGEFLLARDRGEAPDPGAYQRRFPVHAERLRLLLEVDRAMERGPETLPSQADPSPSQARANSQPATKPGNWPSIPGYEVLGELGAGGMGVVYKAWQERLKRVVAVKVIRGGAATDAEVLARFRTEGEAVARLAHPNIVQVHEVGEHEGRPFLTLEYVDAGTLEAKLAGTPQLPRPSAEMLEVLARAVETAHQRGIVHRDLKPANVLLTADGTPKITDFGLAKLLVGGEGQTQTGAILGTPSYMAPEQAGGRVKEVGPAADVYGLGAILYEMLTGRPPFRGATPMDTLFQVVTGEVVAPSRLQPKLPRDLETICLKCLEREPRKRYASAGELADELHRFVAGEPIRSRPVGAVGRLLRWCRRKPALASATGLAALALLTTLVVAIWFAAWQARTAYEARRLSANLALEQAQTLCDQGDVGRGMLWLARALELAPEEDRDLQRVIRLNLGAWKQRLHPLQAALHHGSNINTMALSPDGKTLVTGGFDKIARLWDVTTGQPIGEVMRHGDGMETVAFRPDGKAVLTASLDGTARLWDSATARPLGPVIKHDPQINMAAFSPDGLHVATAGGDGMARVWKAATGEAVGVPVYVNSTSASFVTFSPDSRTLAAAGGSASLFLCEVPSGKLLATLPHGGDVYCAAFSPDGKLIATGCKDHLARLWDAASKQLLATLPHQHVVWRAVFSPDSKTLLTGGRDHTARLWEAPSGRPIGLPLLHQAPVWAVAFTPDGRTVVTGSEDGTARLWHAATGKPQGGDLSQDSSVECLAVSPDSQTLVTGNRAGTVRIFQIGTQGQGGPVLRLDGTLQALAFSPDGKTVATGGFGSTAQVWDARTGEMRFRLVHKRMVWALAFSPDGSLLATGADDFTARLWEVSTGKLSQEMMHRGPVESVAFSPDGKWLLTGSYDRDGNWEAGVKGEGQLWDVATGEKVGPALKHQYSIQKVAFSPTEPVVVTAGGYGEEGEARLWRVPAGTPIGAPFPLGAGSVSVAFSPNGKTILLAGVEQTGHLLDAMTGQPVGQPLVHSAWVQSVAFSPDGKLVVTGSEDRAARLWDAATGRPVGAPLSHLSSVASVAFSPDSRTLATGSGDGATRFWDVRTGKRIGPRLAHDDGVKEVVFSPDGETVLAGENDAGARFWPVPAVMEGKVEKITLQIQVATGLELDRDSGVIRGLDAEGWQERARRLGGGHEIAAEGSATP